MSDNNKKPNDTDKLLGDLSGEGTKFNDMEELLEWMASPRVYWDNFQVTLPLKKSSDIKWIATTVSEA